MCKKSPAVIYFYKKLNSTKKSVFKNELKDSPLTARELSFILDVADGLTIAELADKHCKSLSRISEWKREVCEKIQAFDVANLRR